MVLMPTKLPHKCLLLVLVWFSCFVIGSLAVELDHNEHGEFVVVHIPSGGLLEAQRLADQHGYVVHGQVGSLDGYYELSRKGRRISKREAQETFDKEPSVLWHQIQVPKVRVKRDFKDDHYRAKRSPNLSWTDPEYGKQWYLHKGAAGNFDMHVVEAWKLGYTGKGVVISILDDGIQGSHPDLAANYDPAASTDINDHDSDPTPRDNGDNKHGTRCAGEVSAIAGNSWCGVGIAYNSSIGGVRMLDGPVSDSVEAASLSFNPGHIDIYSASWGPEDDGKTVDGPGPLAKAAFENGIKKGRKGKGNIFIWASGNGGSHQDSCSCDGYTTSIYTLSVSSATFDHQKPWYLEECPSTLTTTYSSGGMGQPAIVTVDMPNSCTDSHTGTSASAPLAAGIVALALEANPQLTWRDVQHLVVRTSDPTPLLPAGNFISNGVKRKVSNKFGYGMMNAEGLVRLAKTWKNVPPQHVCTYEYHIDPPNPRPLIGKFKLNFTLNVPGCQGDKAVNFLEQVHAILSIQYSQRGDLTIKLISPMGTESTLLPPRFQDVNPSGFMKWPFLSVQQWGENPRGIWTLIVENAGRVENSGAFLEFSLVLYGTEFAPEESDQLITVSTSTRANLGYPIGDDGGQMHQNNQTIIYQNCHKLCDPLKGCYKEDSVFDCVKCSNFSSYKRNRGGKMCVENCANGSYADINAKRCKQCLAECESCSNAESCSTCPEGKIMTVSPDAAHLLHGRCLLNCPEGSSKSVGPDGKPVCTMEKTFQPCGVGYFMTDDKRCVARCPDGYFASETFQCLPCHLVCRTCFGPHINECVTCSPGYRQNSANQQCEPGSSGAHGSVVSMNRICSASEYYDQTSQSCVACPKAVNGSQIGPCRDVTVVGRLHVGVVVLLLCALAVVIFFFIFGCLMWRDRHYDRNAKLYAYSKLPMKYTLDSKTGPIGSDSASQKLRIKGNEEEFSVIVSEDSDEEDTLFPHQ